MFSQTKTSHGERLIEAPEWLIARLRELRLSSKFSKDDDYIFCSSSGRPLGHGNLLDRGLYPALKRAGIPQHSFHSLRHSHSAIWLKSGGDPVTLSKRLGHSAHRSR